ncbi:type I-E CRISPR-associated endoribonuclease Cas2e [Brevibacterium otitidis]|uniref:Type I-E CRISPR-associated endoribonuclease Cas2e n=1 Tax=Brevibacterium otitidis TaxID=53364 RepID=A0ABV5X682_9MICO|nr:hypothetical protein GCM10023233_25480 [Brevibacterium otitidis]
MIVLVLSACPQGLRGSLTKWMYEVTSGVFVGNVSARIRHQLWDEVHEHAGTGRAILIWSSDGEQRMRFAVKDHSWIPVDLDGLTLMRRPAAQKSRYSGQMRKGWSRAAAQQNARKFRRR